MTFIFPFLETINNFIWAHVAFLFIFGLGLYFSVRSRFFQLRKAGSIVSSFISYLTHKSKDERGIHPLKAFFAAIGGCIGIGNIVGICTAVEIGGPGALFWTWIGALFGMLIQYAEVYLGIRYRVKNQDNNYDGGPMYFLPVAYKNRWIAPLVCVLLCIYGVELFMFNVMADSIAVNWNISIYWVIAGLLIAILAVALGGIRRVGEVCSAIIPLFIVFYVTMCLWVLWQKCDQLPAVFKSILLGAFTSQAAQGGFVGSTIMLTMSMGLSRGAYSGDLGIGYNAIIYSESRTKEINRIASLPMIGIFLDTFVICTLSILVVLVTNYWKSGIDVSLMVQEALGLYFPYTYYFMPFFLFLLGYSTILAYFVVGVKCAKFLSPKWGPKLYYLYAAISLPFFALVEPPQAFVVMSLVGASLLVLNLFGIFLLRKEITFTLES